VRVEVGAESPCTTKRDSGGAERRKQANCKASKPRDLLTGTASEDLKTIDENPTW